MEEPTRYYGTLYQCPLVRLDGFVLRSRLPGAIYAYLDFGGLTGTGRDALAEGMLAIAAERGALRPGQPVAEIGSGPFAAALAIAAAVSGHPCFLVVPSNLPIEQSQSLRELGANLVTHDPRGGQHAALTRMQEVVSDKKAYFVDYRNNDDNPEFHRRVTGPAIYRTLGTGMDAVVAGVDTGGTISGVGECIKSWEGFCRVTAVDLPGKGASHIARHASAAGGPVPGNYNPYVVDTLLSVSEAEAKAAADAVLRSDGLPAGLQAGAVLAGAAKLLRGGLALRPVCIFQARRTQG